MATATTSAQGRYLLLRPNAPLITSDKIALGSKFGDESFCKPRLMGERMPTLDWPDTPSGPWSEASKPRRSEEQQRKLSIARWLEEDSDDERPQEEQSKRHPMVAKVCMDRRRKELLIQSFAIPTPSSTTIGSESSRSASSSRKLKRRRSKETESPSLRRQKLRKHDAKTSLPGHLSDLSHQFITPRKKKSKKSRKNLSAHPVALTTTQIGCQCGQREDDGTPMIQCDGCNAWYHIACSGLSGTDQMSEEDWYCIMCCEVVTTNLPTPSTLSSGLSVTPIFPRSAILAGQQVRLSQGQLPVFAHPVETPHGLRDEAHVHSFSSALALAPSPVVHSASTAADAIRRPSGQFGGRSRASRVGWHMNEPGSPLERKSVSSFASHKRNLSGGGAHSAISSAFYSPSSRSNRSAFINGHDHNDSLSMAAADAYLRTPSPRLSAATPTPQRTRQASSNYSLRTSAAYSHNASGSNHRREQNHPVREFDDVFSTPSRILNGSSSWGQLNTSMMRHSRQNSISSAHGNAVQADQQPWELSTPTRHMIDAGFHSDYSGGAAGGLPSLVHSSGGLDIGEFAGWHHLQMSPTSSTRAAVRARQQSFNGGNHTRRASSSVRRPATPERSSTFDAPSSSPFPKTPTFVTDMYQLIDGMDDDDDDDNADAIDADGGISHRHLSAGRTLSNLTHALASSPRAGNGVSPATSHARAFGVQGKAHNGSNGSSIDYRDLAGLQGPVELKARNQGAAGAGGAAKHRLGQHGVKARTRNASNDLMAGLGIGLDINDATTEWM